MSLALQCLVGLTLLVCGAVAALPELARDRIPRSRALQSSHGGASLWLVQAPAQRWYLAGQPIETGRLAALLRHQGGRAAVHYLPSAALPIGEISSSLRWLRSLGSGPVLLELPPSAGP
ncbi:MAG: hypothetical protein NTV57_17425 [Cyanobacteria bacterium]|nr:hypothetical protein [Cyanobacteriota bacterium]